MGYLNVSLALHTVSMVSIYVILRHIRCILVIIIEMSWSVIRALIFTPHQIVDVVSLSFRDLSSQRTKNLIFVFNL